MKAGISPHTNGHSHSSYLISSRSSNLLRKAAEKLKFKDVDDRVGQAMKQLRMDKAKVAKAEEENKGTKDDGKDDVSPPKKRKSDSEPKGPAPKKTKVVKTKKKNASSK